MLFDLRMRVQRGPRLACRVEIKISQRDLVPPQSLDDAWQRQPGSFFQEHRRHRVHSAQAVRGREQLAFDFRMRTEWCPDFPACVEIQILQRDLVPLQSLRDTRERQPMAFFQ